MPFGGATRVGGLPGRLRYLGSAVLQDHPGDVRAGIAAGVHDPGGDLLGGAGDARDQASQSPLSWLARQAVRARQDSNPRPAA